jgi:hypothetical protein
MGVVIETPQLFMEITLVSIESLFIHEETIPSALKELSEQLVAEQVLKHPIIVDSDTRVVLDGMHRVAALKSLNFKLMPVCLVDYHNPAIKLFAWYREFDNNTPYTEFFKIISAETSFSLHSSYSEMAFDLVKNRKVVAAFAKGEKCYLVNSSKPLSIREIYDEISKIETLAEQLGYHLFYSTESDANESIQSGSRLVLIVPSLTKEEVLESALEKKIFAQKTTRHVVPARPLFVNIPLSWLNQSNLSEANQKLKEHLERKQIIKRDPGAIINGRRYEESAYLFTDSK